MGTAYGIELVDYKTVKQDKVVYWWASAASIGVFNEKLSPVF